MPTQTWTDTTYFDLFQQINSTHTTLLSKKEKRKQKQPKSAEEQFIDALAGKHSKEEASGIYKRLLENQGSYNEKKEYLTKCTKLLNTKLDVYTAYDADDKSVEHFVYARYNENRSLIPTNLDNELRTSILNYTHLTLSSSIDNLLRIVYCPNIVEVSNLPKLPKIDSYDLASVVRRHAETHWTMQLGDHKLDYLQYISSHTKQGMNIVSKVASLHEDMMLNMKHIGPNTDILDIYVWTLTLFYDKLHSKPVLLNHKHVKPLISDLMQNSTIREFEVSLWHNETVIDDMVSGKKVKSKSRGRQKHDRKPKHGSTRRVSRGAGSRSYHDPQAIEALDANEDSDVEVDAEEESVSSPEPSSPNRLAIHNPNHGIGDDFYDRDVKPPVGISNVKSSLYDIEAVKVGDVLGRLKSGIEMIEGRGGTAKERAELVEYLVAIGVGVVNS